MSDEPRLREQLDRELAGVATTPQARRRFLDAVSGTRGAGATAPGGRPSAPRVARSRWPVAAAVAAVTALTLVPGAVVGYLQVDASSPAGTTVGEGASSAGAPPSPTIGSATSASASAPVPSTSARPVASTGATRYLDLDVPVRRVRAGQSVVVRAVTTDRPLPAADPSQARTEAPTPEPPVIAGPVPAEPAARQPALTQPADTPPADTQPAPVRATVAPSPAPAVRTATVTVDWGDGSSSDDRVTCTDAAGTPPRTLTFRHAYRRPGTYVVVLAAGPDGCWAAPARRTATVVVE